MAQMIKNLPAMQETRVQSLGQEGPLEKGMATHSSILTWEILHGQRSLVGYSPWGQSQTRLSNFHSSTTLQEATETLLSTASSGPSPQENDSPYEL